MAKKQLVSFEISEEWLDLYCANHGYQEKITTPVLNEKLGVTEDVVKPNPESKIDFLEGCLIRNIEAVVTEHKRAQLHNKLVEEVKSSGGITRIKKK